MSHTEHNNKNEQSSKNQNDQGPIIEPSNEPMLFGNPFQDDKSGKGSERPGSANGKKPRKNQRTNIVTALVGVVIFAFVFTQFFNIIHAEEIDELSTSEFVQAVEQGRVQDAVYSAGEYSVTGTYYPLVSVGSEAIQQVNDIIKTYEDALSDEDFQKLAPTDTHKEGEEAIKVADEPRKYHATYVGSDSLQALMQEHNVSYQTKLPNGIIDTLISFLPMIVLVGLMLFFFNQMAKANNSQMSFGKAKAKKTTEERPDVRFSDVAGEDEAVEELQEIKDFLMNPEKYKRLGAKIPRGCLLVGPPGTGKTLLARAVAGEASVPFFSISGSEFVEMFVGVGASRVRSLFEQAKEAAPAIIFIDEIDAVGRQRGAGLGGGHDEREQTLNQLLVEMDGFEKDSTVVLLAATNRVDVLDPALLRPGRFDRQVIVDAPDVKGREKILQVHAKNKPIGPDVDLKRISQLTSGMTGADLMNLMNEAALLTARRNKNMITMSEVNEAMERLMAGPERKTRVLTEKTRETIAYHESGHALVGYLLENTDPVHKITIVPRGMALGYTMSVPDEDKFLVSRSAMIDDLAMFMGGRVAEEIFCGDITTGASNDLERATKQARKMVVTYGMSEALGQQTFGEPNHEVFLGRDYGNTQDYSPETAQRIDEEVARLMKDAHDTAYRILSEHKDQMHLMAKVLLERETVDGDACQALLANTWDEYLKTEAENTEEAQAAPVEQFAPQQPDQPIQSAQPNQPYMPANPTQPGDQQ